MKRLGGGRTPLVSVVDPIGYQVTMGASTFYIIFVHE